jgi:hypothetical protein
MKSMKSLLGLYMMSAMFGAEQVFAGEKPKHRPAPEPQPKDIIPNGLKKFKIDGVEVWAINERNAKRKAKKL